jgi:hypothetical protein
MMNRSKNVSGEKEKLYESYMEYADLNIINQNIPQAIRLLFEVETFVKVNIFYDLKRKQAHKHINSIAVSWTSLRTITSSYSCPCPNSLGVGAACLLPHSPLSLVISPLTAISLILPHTVNLSFFRST